MFDNEFYQYVANVEPIELLRISSKYVLQVEYWGKFLDEVQSRYNLSDEVLNVALIYVSFRRDRKFSTQDILAIVKYLVRKDVLTAEDAVKALRAGVEKKKQGTSYTP